MDIKIKKENCIILIKLHYNYKNVVLIIKIFYLLIIDHINIKIKIYI